MFFYLTITAVVTLSTLKAETTDNLAESDNETTASENRVIVEELESILLKLGKEEDRSTAVEDVFADQDADVIKGMVTLLQTISDIIETNTATVCACVCPSSLLLITLSICTLVR